jgi:hypothetical protein
MKYFVPPVLALLLMGWPTVSSLLSGAAGSSPGSAGGPTSEQALKAAEAELRKALETFKNLDALAEATAKPYGTAALPASAVPLPVWQDYVSLSTELRSLLEVMSGFPEPSSPAIEAKAAEEIKTQLGKAKTVAGAAKIEKVKPLAQDYVARLETAEQRVADRGANEKLLLEAQALFAAKKYGDCEKKFGDWKGDLTPEAKVLRERTQFWVQAEPLVALNATVHLSKIPRDWADAVRRLTPIVDPGLPASATPAETEVFASLKRAKESFETRVKVAGLPPRPLGQWAQNAKQVLASVADAYSRQYCKTRLREVIEGELPATKRTADENYQEAFTVPDDVRLLGTFQRQGQGWYKYWSRGKNVQDEKESRICLARDITAPGFPLTLRVIQQYTEARAQLSERLNDRSAWEGFLATCQQLATELSQRYKVGMDVSFAKEISFTQEVLANWEDLQDFLTP